MEPQSLPLTTSFGQVRRARPSDSPQLLPMIMSLAAHHGDDPTLTADNLQRDLFTDPPWVSVLVAERDEVLIGYAALCGLTQLHFGTRGMDMHHLFTDASFRNQGVGRELVKAARIEALSQSCRYLAVGTHPDNLKAQAFYLSLGFERKDAYPPRFSVQLD